VRFNKRKQHALVAPIRQHSVCEHVDVALERCGCCCGSVRFPVQKSRGRSTHAEQTDAEGARVNSTRRQIQPNDRHLHGTDNRPCLE
jgi:hypothetical protein